MINEKNFRLIREEMLGVGSFLWTIENQERVEWSVGMYHMLNVNEKSMTLKEMKGMVALEELSEINDNFNYNIGNQKQRFEFLIRVNCPGGNLKKLNVRIHAEYEDDNLVRVIGACMDLTHNNERDYTTRLNDEKFYRLFGDAPIGMSLLRTDGTCFLCNDSFVESVQFKEYELKDLPFHVLVEEEDQHKFINMFGNMLANKIPSFRNDFRIVNKKGEKIWHDITVSSVKDVNDRIKYIIVMAQPSQRNKKETPRKGVISTIRDEVQGLSLKDPMSGLYNRQYLLRRLRELILMFYEKHLTFSALLIDIDHIKQINEKYGYECGDKIIHDLSDIFLSLTRDTDICARWGGEEFVIVFPEMDIDTAIKLAERLRYEVKNTILMWEGKEIQMTVSVGVTSYTTDDTMKTFLNKVDEALFQDKKDRRDSVHII